LWTWASFHPQALRESIAHCYAPAGWRSHGGSHKQLENPNYPYQYTWAFHDSDEIGPVMLAKIAKRAGFKPEDL
jgi:predicted RNA binding protein YcfA (HicA-like mRNA interferase family)